MSRPSAHDLVRIDPRDVVGCDVPAWVADAVSRTPWAVVRRDRPTAAIPIGIRGRTRAERFAAEIDAHAIGEIVKPWSFDVRASENARLRDAYLRVADAARPHEIAVGLVGSFGYELATGERVTHSASDLDLIVDSLGCSRTILDDWRARIDAIAERTGVRVDVELQFPIGGAALREVLDARTGVLFKTASGPKVLPCPL